MIVVVVDVAVEADLYKLLRTDELLLLAVV